MFKYVKTVVTHATIQSIYLGFKNFKFFFIIYLNEIFLIENNGRLGIHLQKKSHAKI